ncbi:hypothetical protein [Rhizobium leguminosarum]|uniref:Myb-like domain-containing protein n=1 Tax=Rhizobium leguminosarum TaxID=384 RepID=A0A7K3VEZ8_RHILE|nr:hypothetical protein [Rhizobium leguminosarum]NEK15706.1 hypothetical protein [Rhizobium leguminosarum]
MSLSFYARNVAKSECSRRQIRRQMEMAGRTLRGDKFWTEKECEVIRQCGGDFDKIQKRLKHRTRIAISAQCRKMGIRKRIRHEWTAADISRLGKLYPSAAAAEICAIFSHSTWVNIRQVAQYHGFRRRDDTYSLTGYPTLDEVRRRCREIKWSMIDLDKAARTGQYFSKSRWIGKKINHRALGRAIEALDGTVKAEWREY